MDAKSEMVDISACKKELRIEIPAEVVTQEFNRAYVEISRYAKVAGFRPGRVPLGVVKKKFAKEAREEVIQHILPVALGTALRERNLNPAAEPRVSDLKVEEAEPMTLAATIEVFQDFELKDYRNLSLGKPEILILDDDVDSALEQVRHRNGQMIPVEDRPTQSGDHVTVKMSSWHPDAEGKRGEMVLNQDQSSLELGDAGLIEDFTQNLVGASLGEVKSFNVTYPEDYGSADLAGKQVAYEVTVEAIHRKELPELDDDFAKALGQDLETLEQLRDRLRVRLHEQAENDRDQALREATMAKLVEQHQFDVPETIVEHQLRTRLRKLARAAAARGIPPDSKEIDWPALAVSERERAVRDVQGSLILDRIGTEEKIEVSDAELDAEVEALAKALRQSALELRARLTKEGSLDTMRGEMKNRKALQFVIDNAKMEEGLAAADEAQPEGSK